MSEKLVQLVADGYKAWNQGDHSWVLEHMAEDVEWIAQSKLSQRNLDQRVIR